MGFEPVWTSTGQQHQQPPNIERHPTFERMLCKMSTEARSSFSIDQLALLSKITKPPPPLHWIDYRVSLPFFGGRYYLTFLFGKERRVLSRIKSEGQASLTKTSIVYVAVLWLLISISLLASLVLLYVIKSAVGLDLFSGPSVFHDFAYIRFTPG